MTVFKVFHSRQLTNPFPRHFWVDDFPFPKVGYISSLDSTWFMLKSWPNKCAIIFCLLLIQVKVPCIPPTSLGRFWTSLGGRMKIMEIYHLDKIFGIWRSCWISAPCWWKPDSSWCLGFTPKLPEKLWSCEETYPNLNCLDLWNISLRKKKTPQTNAPNERLVNCPAWWGWSGPPHV